jgi:hypothetical protein
MVEYATVTAALALLGSSLSGAMLLAAHITVGQAAAAIGPGTNDGCA